MKNIVKKTSIMDADGIRRALIRIAHEITEKNRGVENVALVGIRTDLTTMGYNPVIHGTEIDFDVTGKHIVLVDDVLYTGRTIRAALDALIDMGRPKSIQLAVLIDRGHRELPIRADYAGKNVPTSRKETIEVALQEEGKTDEVILGEIAD